MLTLAAFKYTVMNALDPLLWTASKRWIRCPTSKDALDRDRDRRVAILGPLSKSAEKVTRLRPFEISEALRLVVPQGFAVSDERQRFRHRVGVDGRDEFRKLVRQRIDDVVGEDCP